MPAEEKSRWGFRYGDVEKILYRALDAGGKVETLRARLRHLRRKKAPPLPETGTGRQINYSWHDIERMYLALSLNQLGLSPEQIARLFAGKNKDMVRAGFDLVFMESEKKGKKKKRPHYLAIAFLRLPADPWSGQLFVLMLNKTALIRQIETTAFPQSAVIFNLTNADIMIRSSIIGLLKSGDIRDI